MHTGPRTRSRRGGGWATWGEGIERAPPSREEKDASLGHHGLTILCYVSKHTESADLKSFHRKNENSFSNCVGTDVM